MYLNTLLAKSSQRLFPVAEMLMSLTSRPTTANSMVAASPPLAEPCGGIMLPALRRMNRSPGLDLVNRLGSMRESEQVMNSVSGFCPLANCSKSPWRRKDEFAAV